MFHFVFDQLLYYAYALGPHNIYVHWPCVIGSTVKVTVTLYCKMISGQTTHQRIGPQLMELVCLIVKVFRLLWNFKSLWTKVSRCVQKASRRVHYIGRYEHLIGRYGRMATRYVHNTDHYAWIGRRYGQQASCDVCTFYGSLPTDFMPFFIDCMLLYPYYNSLLKKASRCIFRACYMELNVVVWA